MPLDLNLDVRRLERIGDRIERGFSVPYTLSGPRSSVRGRVNAGLGRATTASATTNIGSATIGASGGTRGFINANIGRGRDKITIKSGGRFNVKAGPRRGVSGSISGRGRKITTGRAKIGRTTIGGTRRSGSVRTNIGRTRLGATASARRLGITGSSRIGTRVFVRGGSIFTPGRSVLKGAARVRVGTRSIPVSLQPLRDAQNIGNSVGRFVVRQRVRDFVFLRDVTNESIQNRFGRGGTYYGVKDLVDPRGRSLIDNVTGRADRLRVQSQIAAYQKLANRSFRTAGVVAVAASVASDLIDIINIGIDIRNLVRTSFHDVIYDVVDEYNEYLALEIEAILTGPGSLWPVDSGDSKSLFEVVYEGDGVISVYNTADYAGVVEFARNSPNRGVAQQTVDENFQEASDKARRRAIGELNA